jgi:hypothetical protein
VDDRLDVRADHAQLLVEVEVLERPCAAEARVVHENRHLEPALPDLGHEPLPRRMVGEVAADHLGVHVPLGLDLVRQRRQAVLPTRHERHAVAAVGELARDVGADAGRRPGDQRGRLRRGWGERHGAPAYNPDVASEDPFGGLFGDPDELRRRMAEIAEQMQGAQKVAWADNAIKLAVDMTVAGINRLNLQGNTEQQADELRAAMSRIFPEAVTLVREAREGFGT